MPEIELDGGPDDLGRLYAVMYFPDDENRQQQYLAVQRVRRALLVASDDEEIRPSRRELGLLIEAPGYIQLGQEITVRPKAGIVAGDLLSALYVMHRFDLRPSLNRAIWGLQRYAESGVQFGDGTGLPRGRKLIREHWDRFSCVAHR